MDTDALLGNQAEMLLQKALNRKPRRRARPRTPRGPRKAEASYVKQLRKFSQQTSAVIAKELRRSLSDAQDGSRLDAVFDVDAVIRGLRGLREGLTNAARRMLRIITREGRRLSDENREEMQRVFRIEFAAQSPEMQAALEGWIADNVELIQSVPAKVLDDIEELVTKAASSGMRVETLRGLIRERFDVGARRAELIARDQILKANSGFTQTRHREAGIREYTWSTSKDERVRPEHRRLEGKRYSWDNGHPSEGHPGTNFQCRCVAIPVFDDE